MKKIFILLATLALLSLTACISKDATEKLQQVPPAEQPVAPPAEESPSKITGNLITNESSNFDKNNHTAVTNSFEIADGVLTVKDSTTIGKAGEYPWSYVNVDTGKVFTGVTAVKVSYNSNKVITIKFRQETLSQFFAYDLPSTDGETKDVTIQVDQFALPSWVAEEVKAASSLKLAEVTSLDLCPVSVDDGVEYTSTISNLELVY